MWYERHAEQLSNEPGSREKQRVVAGVLLPLFEAHPEHWESVGYLNLGATSKPRSFPQYLDDWHRHSPEKHRPFVRRIAGQFGIAVSRESAAGTAAERADEAGDSLTP